MNLDKPNCTHLSQAVNDPVGTKFIALILSNNSNPTIRAQVSTNGSLKFVLNTPQVKSELENYRTQLMNSNILMDSFSTNQYMDNQQFVKKRWLESSLYHLISQHRLRFYELIHNNQARENLAPLFPNRLQSLNSFQYKSLILQEIKRLDKEIE